MFLLCSEFELFNIIKRAIKLSELRSLWSTIASLYQLPVASAPLCLVSSSPPPLASLVGGIKTRGEEARERITDLQNEKRREGLASPS